MAMRETMKDGSTRIISGLTMSDILATVVPAALLAAYPVGSIRMSVDSANPGTIFGGTWVAWGTGRVPVGIDTGDVSFDVVEETGGAQTHVHNLDSASSGARLRVGVDTGMWNMVKALASDIYTKATTVASPTTISSSSTSGIPLTGNTVSASHLQPYIVCYMWKRTA